MELEHYNMQPEPEKYNENNSMQYLWTKNYLKEVENDLRLPKQDAMVIDIGCGSGNISNEVLFNILNAKVSLKKVIGVDINEKMVNFANAAYLKPNLQFQTLDICTRELPNTLEEKFDLATAFSSFHYFPDQKLAVKNIKKLLKPGGEILLLFTGESILGNIYQTMKENPKWKPYIQNVSTAVDYCLKKPEDYFELFREENFSIQSFRFERSVHRYENEDETKSTVEHVSQFKKNIPGHLWKEFIDENFDLYKKRLKTQKDYNASDGRDFAVALIFVHAIKL